MEEGAAVKYSDIVNLYSEEMTLGMCPVWPTGSPSFSFKGNLIWTLMG